MAEIPGAGIQQPPPALLLSGSCWSCSQTQLRAAFPAFPWLWQQGSMWKTLDGSLRPGVSIAVPIPGAGQRVWHRWGLCWHCHGELGVLPAFSSCTFAWNFFKTLPPRPLSSASFGRSWQRGLGGGLARGSLDTALGEFRDGPDTAGLGN